MKDLFKKVAVGFIILTTGMICLIGANVISLSLVTISSLSYVFYPMICIGILGISSYIIVSVVEKLNRIDSERRHSYKNYWFPCTHEGVKKKWWQ